MSRLLDAKERDRFATWLEQEAESDRAIAEQAGKFGTGMDVIVKRNLVRAAACLLIANDLRCIEDGVL